MSSSNECLYTARRSGVTDRLERLLIATVYTHYGARNDIISGTAQLIPFFGVLTDRSHEGKFILLEEVQDLQAGESEISMCEIRQDEYQAVQ